MPSKFTRREFIGQAAAYSGMLGLAGFAHGKDISPGTNNPGPAPADFYGALLTRWCEALVQLQVQEIKRPELYGGILCPLCARIHGRSSDAIHALLRLARVTGKTHYLDAAVRLQAWSNHVSRPDGSWVNEAIGNDWKGITVGGVLALAGSLRFHGELLDAKVRKIWEERMARGARYVYDYININTGNINYAISASGALMAVDQLLGEPRYRVKARELAHLSLDYITKENKLLFGEGNHQVGLTAHGCRAVDLGYNVEESFPNFALYAKISEDREVLGQLVETLRAQLEFMLPDGAWDNSWGTRNFKWTYWGTRTGDGCQAAYGLLAQEDPRFATAAMRNAQLLERCTHDGILTSGPHYTLQGEAPCIHHTFCHARGLATMLDYGQPPLQPAITLPRETAQGVRQYDEIRTWLAALGPWRATVTAYDWIYDAELLPAGHASGGALSVLWHARLGPLLLASVTEYDLMEVSNMQPLSDGLPVPLTPRVELRTTEGDFYSLTDLDVQVQHQADAERITFAVRGELKDRKQKPPAGGPHPFELDYELTANSVIIRAAAAHASSGPARFVLPVICSRHEKATLIDYGVEIAKPGGRLRVTWNAPEIGTDLTARIFHPVPGFQALPLTWELAKNNGVPLQIAIEAV